MPILWLNTKFEHILDNLNYSDYSFNWIYSERLQNEQFGYCLKGSVRLFNSEAMPIAQLTKQ